MSRRLDDAEPVALGVFEHDPLGVGRVLAPVHLARPEIEQALHLGSLAGARRIEDGPVVRGRPRAFAPTQSRRPERPRTSEVFDAEDRRAECESYAPILGALTRRAEGRVLRI